MTDHPRRPFAGLPEYTADEATARARAFRDHVATRRTIRDYTDRPVSREVIAACIEAAGQAPSGANMQPWHFVAVSNPGLKKKMRAAAELEEKAFYQHRASDEWLKALEPLGTNEDKPFMEIAPWLIVVFLKKFTFDENGKRHKNYYTAESVGIACGFLLAALHSAGLATLTHTPSPMKFLNEVLERPADERAYMVVVAGYPAENATVPVITKKTLGEIATFKE